MNNRYIYAIYFLFNTADPPDGISIIDISLFELKIIRSQTLSPQQSNISISKVPVNSQTTLLLVVPLSI